MSARPGDRVRVKPGVPLRGSSSDNRCGTVDRMVEGPDYPEGTIVVCQEGPLLTYIGPFKPFEYEVVGERLSDLDRIMDALVRLSRQVRGGAYLTVEQEGDQVLAQVRQELGIPFKAHGEDAAAALAEVRRQVDAAFSEVSE